MNTLKRSRVIKLRPREELLYQTTLTWASLATGRWRVLVGEHLCQGPSSFRTPEKQRNRDSPLLPETTLFSKKLDEAQPRITALLRCPAHNHQDFTNSCRVFRGERRPGLDHRIQAGKAGSTNERFHRRRKNPVRCAPGQGRAENRARVLQKYKSHIISVITTESKVAHNLV